MREALEKHRLESLERIEGAPARVAIEAAQLGADALLGYFRKRVAIQTKGVANFVSAADLAAETAIVDCIKRHYPQHAIVSEETHRDRADASDVWIIDPLDGTNNYLHGMPHFAVSIGYYRSGVGEVGVVCDPARGDWYVGVRGQGVWYNGVPVGVSEASALSQAMIGCGFYYDRGPMMQATLGTIGELFGNEIHGIRRCGAAALDLAYLACGWFDGFFEYRLSPWDYAAGQVLLREAGGEITDCVGGALPLGQASSVCASNGKLHASMLRIIEPRWSALSSGGSA